MKYKLIVSDYDGTTAIGGKINENVISAINRYRNNGGKFVFCTGRHYNSISEVIKTNGVKVDGLITLQGSYAEVDGKTIVEGGLHEKLVIDILNDAHSFGLKGAVWRKDKLFYENSAGARRYASFFDGETETVIATELVNDYSYFVNSKYGYFGKIVFLDVPTDIFNEFIPFINKKYQGVAVANSSGPNFIEIISNDYTKYKSTKKVAKYLGISESETLTIGDSLNDLTLLKYGFGVAVDNADENLKKLAKYIAPSVTENALEFIIDKILKEEDFI